MLDHRHIIILILLAIPAVSLLAYLVPYSLWKYTKEAGLKVSFFTLAGFRLKRLPGGKLMKALKLSKENDINVKLSDLVVHQKGGGDVIRWMEGCAAVKKAGYYLTIEKSAELELDGLDILKVAEILNQLPEQERAV